jgi:hypothetical protein
MKFVPQFLDRLGAWFKLGLAALLLATLVAVDVVAGRDVSLTPFYLVVVLFVVWSAEMIWGSVFLAASLFATVTVGELYGHPFTSRGSFFIDVAGRFMVYVIMLLVAGVARAAHAREKALARSDSLTGLANRAALYERIGIEIERQKRNGGPMTLAASRSAEWFVDEAERLMFSVKRTGKNGVQQLVQEPMPESNAQSAGNANTAAKDAP